MTEVFQPTPRSHALVVSGRLRGQEVFIVGPCGSLPGYWSCVYYRQAGLGARRHEAILTTAQLGPVLGKEASHA